MARVRLLDEAQAARIQGRIGPELRRALAHRPALGQAVGMLNDAVEATILPARLHELVRFRIAELNDCFR
jgi:alkylhydroperoxidase family enzyme